jgi:hypothetical protein
MMNTSAEKIHKIGRWGSALSIFLMFLASIIVVVLVALCICVALDADFLSKYILEVTEEYNITRFMICAFLLIGALLSSALIAALYFANKIFKDMKTSHTPFKAEYIRNMKIISVIIFISGLIILNVTLIVVAVLLYCFSLAFEYGLELQRESDETL